jgi:coenzyme F420 hydrogenase subunit beta
MGRTIDYSLLSIGLKNRSLCTRCGTCTGICPEGAIYLDDDFYPAIAEEKCTECGICRETCPGAKVNYQQLASITFGNQPDDDSFDGYSKLSYVGYTRDEKIKNGGAGGGIITGLLWDLLKHGEVDGCLVTRMNPDKPWLGQSFIARTYEDLTSSQGSKYSILPHNSILAELRNLDGRFAFAGLPCQIHGLRLLADKAPELKNKIYGIIGLFCGGALETYVVPELLKTKKVSPEEISDFQFRGGDWPGKMRAVRKNSEIVDMHYSDYKDGAYNYFTFIYSPMRCLTCIDGSAHFADLSVGDVWTRDQQGNYRFKAHSRMLARTDRGVDILMNAINRGTIAAEDVTSDPHYKTHRAQTKRKGINVPLRIQRLKKKGFSVPVYDRKVPDDATLKERLSERMVTAVHFITRHYYLRFPLTKFLTSRYSIPLIIIRRWLKRRKYRQ